MNIDPTIIVALITLAGVIISALLTKNNLYHELDKKDAVMQQRLDDIDEHIREHNHYAKLFSENVPVIQEQVKVINHRLDDLERQYERQNNNNNQ